VRLVGDALIPPPGMPVPVAETVTLEFVEVTKVNVPVWVLRVRGAKTILNAMLCPGFKLKGRVSPLAENAHGPSFTLLEILTAEEPVFVKLTGADCDPPTGTVPKLTEHGLQVRLEEFWAAARKPKVKGKTTRVANTTKAKEKAELRGGRVRIAATVCPLGRKLQTSRKDMSCWVGIPLVSKGQGRPVPPSDGFIHRKRPEKGYAAAICIAAAH
jgi:hypothetical protein